MKNFIKLLVKKRDSFIRLRGKHPNRVYLGRKEIRELKYCIKDFKKYMMPESSKKHLPYTICGMVIVKELSYQSLIAIGLLEGESYVRLH